MPQHSSRIAFLCILLLNTTVTGRADDQLLGHWPLTKDGRDHSGHGRHAQIHHVDFTAPGPSDGDATAASFNGHNSWLEIPAAETPLNSGTETFTISCMVHTAEALDDTPGDLLSQYDFQKRRGFHLALKTNAGVTCSQANSRQLQFGIDNQQVQPTWTDHGRPGNAIVAFSMCTFDGHLYAATCEGGVGETGHVYRFDGGDTWTSCGAPDQSNAVTALAEYKGQLFAATGKYRLRGSALQESQNENLGGRVFRYAGDSRWIDCGQLPNTEAVGGLVVFRGRLYASSLYRPAGFFRYESDGEWTDCGTPARPADRPGDTPTMRVEAMGVHDGYLWATSYDGGRVFRYDGDQWEDVGQLEDNTQTYAFAVRNGRLYVGTWRSGKVYRLESPNDWSDAGRLGEELEVMGMLVHNGRMIAGSLPLAEVYEFDGGTTWNRLARLDHTPDVKYRRAWTMAEYDGRVFCATLPSGKIFSWSAGRVAMADRSLPAGWHHVAAVKSDDRLSLYVDGKRIAQSSAFDTADYDLSGTGPLRIGLGPNDFFSGRLSDVRLYRGALTAEQIGELSNSSGRTP